MPSIRQLLVFLALAAAAGPFPFSANASAEERPNILFIIFDDWNGDRKSVV